MSADNNVNLAEMSDDDIALLDPTTLDDNSVDSDVDSDETQSVEATDTTDNAGGTAPVDDSDSSGTDSTSDEVDTEPSNADDAFESSYQKAESHQDSDTDSVEEEDSSDASEDFDYKAEFSKVMAPFKAAKREVQVKTTEDARRLMQMGVDYSRKMEAMKPYQRVLKTLEKNDLLDGEKINFLIDLSNKNPDAIKKLLKDSEIDPLDLSLEDNTEYQPNDHSVPENVMALEEVIESIRPSPSFDRTITVFRDEWDTASKNVLDDNPKVLRYINEHMDAGIYDMIADRAANDKLFGRADGLSDLEAYKQAGDALYEEGAFNVPAPNASTPNGTTNQGSSQDSGSRSANNAENLRNRKRAASPTRGNASAKKETPNWATMSDEQIEKFDISSL